jgi:hypothetical protein
VAYTLASVVAKRTPPRTLLRNRKLSAEEVEAGLELSEYQGECKPKTRADCANVPRPCPYVSCRHHLYLNIRSCKKGDNIRLNFPQLAGPTEMEWSCALDEAEAVEGDGMTLDEIGKRLNITRERSRQLEVAVFRKIRKRALLEPRFRILLDLFEAILDRPDPENGWDLLG